MWVLVVAGIIFGIPLLFKAVGLLGGLVGKVIGTVMAAIANLADAIFRKAPAALTVILLGAAGIGGVYIWGSNAWAVGTRVENYLAEVTLLDTNGAETMLGIEVFGVVSVRYLVAFGIGMAIMHVLRRTAEKIVAAVGELEWSV